MDLDSHAAICSDFYVNQTIALKLDLPTNRESVLDMFDRIRRRLPQMDRLKRFEGTIALESMEVNSMYSWLALGNTTIRSGWMNPESVQEACRLHRLVLEIAPAYLSISPIDVEYIEIMFGFDIDAGPSRDAIVFQALLADSPLLSLVELEREGVLDAQPSVSFSLDSEAQVHAQVDVKTRSHMSEELPPEIDHAPISVFLRVKKHGPIHDIDEFGSIFSMLLGYAERLTEERVIPSVVIPIREAMFASPD